MSWSPPSPINANGYITGYRLRITRVEIEDQIEYTFGADETHYVKNGMYLYLRIYIVFIYL